MSKKNNKPLNLDFETAIKELEKIISKMEAGKLTLEDGLKSFEQGIALTNHCRSLLNGAEQKIEILIAEQEGNYKQFELENDDDD